MHTSRPSSLHSLCIITPFKPTLPNSSPCPPNPLVPPPYPHDHPSETPFAKNVIKAMTTAPLSLNTLPPDLAHKILSHLTPSQLTTAASVCTTWYHHSQDENLWRRFNSSAAKGAARKTYLRERAWRSARAIHSTSHPFPAVVHTLRLSPHPHSATFTATLQTVDTALTHSTNGFRQLRPVELMGCAPQCVRLRYCEARARVYAAYGYANGCVALYEMDDVGSQPLRIGVVSTLTGDAVKCVDVLSENGKVGVVGGTADGVLCIACERSQTRLKLSRHGICSVRASDGIVLAGTTGGEVIAYDLRRQARCGYYVGPCSCGVSGVEFASRQVVVAGFSHVVAGNGHRSAAVAWEQGSGERLAAFGRGEGVRSSGALPMVGVGGVRGDGVGKRVGLIVGGVVRVYEVGTWKCEVEAGFEGESMGIDLDGGRIGIGVGRRVHVLDFAKAVSGMPEDAKCFRPVLREWEQQLR